MCVVVTCRSRSWRRFRFLIVLWGCTSRGGSGRRRRIPLGGCWVAGYWRIAEYIILRAILEIVHVSGGIHVIIEHLHIQKK